jgi:phosphoglycolate phosphatase
MKTLIFDFDGTIADSFETLLCVFEAVTDRKDKLTTKEIKLLRGQSLRKIIKYLKIRSWQIPHLIMRAKKLIGEKVKDIEPFADMPQVLSNLHKDGCYMYILSTNSAENIGVFLKKNKLDSYFTAIYGDIGLRSKSSAIKKIIKKEKLVRADCFYICDEVRDVEAAKKAGIKSVGVTWGFNYPNAIKSAKPDYVAGSPRDLLGIF